MRRHVINRRHVLSLRSHDDDEEEDDDDDGDDKYHICTCIGRTHAAS